MSKEEEQRRINTNGSKLINGKKKAEATPASCIRLYKTFPRKIHCVACWHDWIPRKVLHCAQSSGNRRLTSFAVVVLVVT